MSKIYNEINTDFTQIPNAILQRDISLKARGLFYTLLQLYGKEFEISREKLISLSEKDKSIATYSAIKELEEAGLLKRIYFGKIRKINFILTLEN